MSLLDKIKVLASTHHLTIAELERKLDFSNGSLRKWDSSTPSGDKIEKVADYFNVSTDYLFGRTDNPNIAKDTYVTPSGKEMDLAQLADGVMLFDGKPLTEEEKITIQGIIKGYLDSRKG